MKLEPRHPQKDIPRLYYDPSLISLTLLVEGKQYLLNDNPPRNKNLYRPSNKLILLKAHPSILRNTDLLLAARDAVKERGLGDLLSQSLSEIQIH